MHSHLVKELHSVIQLLCNILRCLLLHVKRFCKHEICHCHYAISVCIGMNCWAWTCGMNESHKWPSSFLCQCTVSVLWVLIIFWCRNMKCNAPCVKEVVYDWLFVCVIHGDWHQCILQYHLGLEGIWEKGGDVNSTQICVTNEETSYWIINVCYSSI